MAEQSKKKKTSGASPEIVDIPEDAVVPSKGKGGKAAGEKAKAASAKPKASSTKPEATAAKPKTAKKKASTDKSSTPRKPSKPRKVKVEPGISRGEATGSRRRHPRRAVPRGKLADMSEDMFLEEWDERPRRKRNKRRDQRTVAVNLLLIAAILALVTAGGMLIHRRQAFLEMKQVVEAQTFYDGTTVEGVDVSNMTLNAAKDYWQRDIEPHYADRGDTGRPGHRDRQGAGLSERLRGRAVQRLERGAQGFAGGALPRRREPAVQPGGLHCDPKRILRRGHGRLHPGHRGQGGQARCGRGHTVLRYLHLCLRVFGQLDRLAPGRGGAQGIHRAGAGGGGRRRVPAHRDRRAPGDEGGRRLTA